MNAYKIKIVKLCEETIRIFLPRTSRHLHLGDAVLGRQPEDAVFVGCFEQLIKRDVPTPLMKLIMKEVLSGKPPHKFEVFISGEYIEKVEQLLQKAGNATVWIIFYDTFLAYYSGTRSPWSKYSLKMYPDNNYNSSVTLLIDNCEVTKTNLNAQELADACSISISHLRQKVPKYPAMPQANFLQYPNTLNDIKHGVSYTLFAVVKEIVKQTSILTNQSKHTMLALVDPSCLQESAVRDDLLLHIFFNDTRDHFPTPIQTGDILRLKDMKGDYYPKERKMFGKIYSSKLVVIFNIKEERIVPVTNDKAYSLTNKDEEMVWKLHKWWSELRKNNITSEVEPPVKTISDIEGSCVFSIYCKISDIRIGPSKEALLTVKDGTKAKVHTTTFAFDIETKNWSPTTEEDDFDFASSEIEILILKELHSEASRLEVGDFVFLTNISCYDSQKSKKRSSKVFVFEMKSFECIIARLLPQSSRGVNLKRAIEELDKSSSSSDEKETIVKETSIAKGKSPKRKCMLLKL